MVIKHYTQPNQKECLLCGAQLSGKQRKFCSHEHRLEYYKKVNKEKRRTYIRDYMAKYRVKKGGAKYCAHCGLKLPKHKKRFCSKSHRELFYKQNDTLHIEVLKDSRMERDIPIFCDECGGTIVIDGYDIVCKSCGLVY